MRGRQGLTLVELLVAMTAGLAVLGAASPFFIGGSRAVQQQMALREVQTAIHITAETLLRGIRAADAVLPGSGAERLVLEGGDLASVCGGDELWIEAGAAGLACGPVGQAAVRVLSAAVTSIELAYGIDGDEDGAVDAFTDAPSDPQLDDALAVRFRLAAERVEGRGRIGSDAEFVAVIRTAVFRRIELETAP